MPVLHTLVASTRPGRVGPAIARWFDALARADGRFEVRLVDLAEVNLPLLDEPRHPRLGHYLHPHTRAWSALVASADAFVVVTPEYNHAVPAPLVNAFDYLAREWAYKPIGFVSYGGLSGGLRAVQTAKPIVTALKMVPIPEGVAIPFFNHYLRDGAFAGNEQQASAATLMLDELWRWTEALAPLRDARPAAERSGAFPPPPAAEGAPTWKR